MTKAIRLLRVGDHTLVQVEYKRGEFVTIIKEPFDNAFCHIVEPRAIDRLVAEADVVGENL